MLFIPNGRPQLIHFDIRLVQPDRRLYDGFGRPSYVRLNGIDGNPKYPRNASH